MLYDDPGDIMYLKHMYGLVQLIKSHVIIDHIDMHQYMYNLRNVLFHTFAVFEVSLVYDTLYDIYIFKFRTARLYHAIIFINWVMISNKIRLHIHVK